MKAITGESLLYNVSRALTGGHEITYFQFRDICSFIEMIALHSEVIILTDQQYDSSYREEYKTIVNGIEEKTNIKIWFYDIEQILSISDINVINIFNSTLGEVYKKDIGVNIKDLLEKPENDRSRKEEIQVFLNIFSISLEKETLSDYTEYIYDQWKNSEFIDTIIYLLRGHLLSSLAKHYNYTPVHTNIRLIIKILEDQILEPRIIGSLASNIYQMSNKLFINSSADLAQKSVYPRLPVLLNYIITKVVNREELLNKIFSLNNQFSVFVKEYDNLNNIISDENNSFHERKKALLVFKDTVDVIWNPMITSFGNTKHLHLAGKVLSDLFNKYGLGDAKYIVKEDNGDEGFGYSTPSLTKLGIDAIKSIRNNIKTKQIFSWNEPMLEVFEDVFKMKDSYKKSQELLPIKDFSRTINKTIDRKSY